MTRRAVVALAVGAWLCAPALAAPPEGPPDAGIEVSGVDVSDPPHVVIEFTAPAALTGGPLTGADVSVTENGEPIASTLTVVPTAGLEVVLAIDTSGSMNEGDAIGAAKEAAQRFLDVLPAEVPVGVVAFADGPSLLSPLTTDRALLRQAIGGLAAGGETALFDAMVLARSVFSGATPDRQIVLLSDGGNTAGSAGAADALAVAGEVRTSVVALTSTEADPQVLQQLADANSGSLTTVADPAALSGLYEDIADSLVHRYRIELDATATGGVEYGLTVDTAAGPVTVTAAATVPTEGSVPPATDPSTAPVPTVVAPTSPPLGGDGGNGRAAGLSTENWLRLGTAAVFGALCIGLLTFFLGRSPDRGNPALAPARGSARGAPTPDERDQGSGIGAKVESMADRALVRSNRRHGVAAELEAAAINLRPGEFAVLAVIGGVASGALLSMFMSVAGVLVGLIGAPVVAWMVIRSKADRRRHQFDDQLADVLHLIVTLLQSGFGLPQALDAVARQAAEPTATEFRRVLMEVRIGRDPTDALEAMAERMKSRDFAWVVSAIGINREVGGELASILEAVSETVRERQRLERQVRTLTAEGRMSAWILTALPLLLVLVLGVVNPGYFDPLKESPGPQLVAIGVILLVVGWLWMHRLIKTR